MNRFLLAFIFCLSFAACVTKSTDTAASEVAAAQIKNYTGGIYFKTQGYNEYDEEYDADGNIIKAKQVGSSMKVQDTYRTAYIDTTTLVKAQELLSIKVIAAKYSEEAKAKYIEGVLEIELSEQGRIQLMNLSMANANKTMYLVLNGKILAQLNVSRILADPILLMDIDDSAQLEDTRAFFEQKD